jgi:hypothetical protein
MSPPVQMKGQRQKEDLTLTEFQGVNVQAKRMSIKDNEFSWLENAQPIGPGNLTVIPQCSSALCQIGGTQTLSSTFSANLNSVDFVLAFTSTGAGYAINLETWNSNPPYTVTEFAAASTFSGSGVVVSAWDNTRIMIGDPNNGLFSWDGTNLTKNGQGVIGSGVITNGGQNYTSAPTVQIYPNGGAVATVEVSGGAISSVSLTDGGSGYTSAPTVVIVGGGGTGAAATASVLNGEVVSITFSGGSNSPGSGYLIPPTIYFTGGGIVGSGMTATATESGGVVTGITITNPGSGYLLPPTVLFTGGGGENAEATIDVMAGPTNITSMATYSGRLWCGYKRNVNYSDVGSFSSFAGAGGSFEITDNTLYENITQLLSANSFLYIFGSSSVDILGNVAVNSGITSFTRTNVTASIGSALPFTVYAYYRAVLFANTVGFYGLSGATPEKLSDNLDQVYGAINFSDPVTGGQVAINRILCAAFMFTFTDTFVNSGTVRPILAIFFNKKWFFASQATTNPLTQLCPVNLNGVPVLFGFDSSNRLYQLFLSQSTAIASIVQTKLYDGKNLLIDKGTQKSGLGVFFNSSQTQAVTVTVDGENMSTPGQTLQGGNTLQFVNNVGNNIYFVNNSNNQIIFTLGGYIFLKSDFSMNGQKYVGLTMRSNSPGLTYTFGAMEYETGATW